MENKQKLLVVDNLALLFRGFYATATSGRIMQTSTGIPTNAIYQYLRYFFHALHTFKPDYAIIANDTGNKTIQEVLQAFGIPLISIDGYEADDIMGSISQQFASPELHVYLLTGDGDALQLVNEHTSVIMMLIIVFL
ncbi:hypothetical protein [Tepidibacillus sp. HK-1]|uniref:5'-3' exonuclease n=1 Tax=Tepidibacillus sp. HK-1 TaxID=1883407 RepID=UPI000853C9EA|nr:hypothetical protein [Tepidibacillus sp. HK-1]GBF10286.1 5'-3' exonuclease [Tepidibacillus sp. HK-1]